MQTDAGHHTVTTPDRILTLKVTLPDGGRFALGARGGSRVVEAMREYGFPLRRDCSSACEGRSCHIRVGKAWVDRLPRPSESETGRLGQVDGADADSRLLCQLAMTADLDGLEVQLTADSLVPQTYWIAG